MLKLNNKGLSLVEVLAAVVLLGLLVSTVLPLHIQSEQTKKRYINLLEMQEHSRQVQMLFKAQRNITNYQFYDFVQKQQTDDIWMSNGANATLKSGTTVNVCTDTFSINSNNVTLFRNPTTCTELLTPTIKNISDNQLNNNIFVFYLKKLDATTLPKLREKLAQSNIKLSPKDSALLDEYATKMPAISDGLYFFIFSDWNFNDSSPAAFSYEIMKY